MTKSTLPCCHHHFRFLIVLVLLNGVIIRPSHADLSVLTDGVVVAKRGESAALSCSYKPQSSPDTFTHLIWKKGTSTVIWIDKNNLTARRGTYDLLADHVSSGNLTIREVQIEDEGNYSCQVNTKNFLAADSQVQLYVIADGPVIRYSNGTRLSGDVIELLQGENVEVDCVISSSESTISRLRISWAIDGGSIERVGMGVDGLMEKVASTIRQPSRRDHGKSLTCRAEVEGVLAGETSVVMQIAGPPDQISIQCIPDGMGARLAPLTKLTCSCVANNSFPAAEIAWLIDDIAQPATRITTTTTPTTRERFTVVSEISYTAIQEDDGKTLKCVVSHVTLTSGPMVAFHQLDICNGGVDLGISIRESGASSLTIQYSVRHVSTIAESSCKLKTCEAEEGFNADAGCIEMSFGKTHGDIVDRRYEVTSLMTSTLYDVTLRCSDQCGVHVESVQGTTTGDGAGGQPLGIREIVFVIIAVVIISSLVIAVTVTVVVRVAVKGIIGSRDLAEPRYPGSPISSSFRNDHNLYVIEEGNEHETDPKIYQEIDTEWPTSPLTQPADILVSPRRPSNPGLTRSNSAPRNNAVVMMYHPAPPPPLSPGPVPRCAEAVAAAHLQHPGAKCGLEDEPVEDHYVPMSPIPDRVSTLHVP